MEVQKVMDLKILGSICFLEAVGTVGNIMGYRLGLGICLAGTSFLTVYTVYLAAIFIFVAMSQMKERG